MVTRSVSIPSLSTLDRVIVAPPNSLPGSPRKTRAAERPLDETEEDGFFSAPGSPQHFPSNPPAAEGSSQETELIEPRSPAGHPPQTPERPDPLQVYSPDRGVRSPVPAPPPLLPRQGGVVPLVQKPEVHAAAKDINGWVSVSFQAAALVFCVSLYYVASSIYRRNYSLLIPAGCWGVVSIVIGTWAEMLETVAEQKNSRVPRERKNVAPLFQSGQPIAIDNVGNTCFINAPTQAIMNDTEYPRVFKAICLREIKRHEAFRYFLSLFPHSTSYLSKVPFLSSEEQKASHDFVCPQLIDVFIRLRSRCGHLEHVYLEKTKKTLRQSYPQFSAILDLFRREARREEDLQRCARDPAWTEVYKEGKVTGALKDEFTRMKKDKVITECFDQWRLNIRREIDGFNAYQSLITAYETALRHEQPVSYRTWISASPIGNVRNLMQNAGGYSQEDVDQFLRCLTKYTLPEEHPEIFFSSIHEAEWAEFKKEDQSEESRGYLAECVAKHQRRAKPDDILSVLPAELKVVDSPKPECIFKISESLTEGANGQFLFDESQKMKETGNNPERSRCAFIDERDGQPKLFYRVREKTVIRGTPNRVILQLGRWTSSGEKINCKVHMPEILKINGASYGLKSIIVHEGEEGYQGHYSATVLKKDQWWYTSDAFVDHALEHVKIALTQGYLYFYEKIEQPVL